MTEKFRVKYHVADGYVGKDRPLYFYIDPSEVEDDMEDSELSELYHDQIQDEFEQKVFAEGENLEDFLVWARGVRDTR